MRPSYSVLACLGLHACTSSCESARERILWQEAKLPVCVRWDEQLHLELPGSDIYTISLYAPHFQVDITRYDFQIVWNSSKFLCTTSQSWYTWIGFPNGLKFFQAFLHIFLSCYIKIWFPKCLETLLRLCALHFWVAKPICDFQKVSELIYLDVILSGSEIVPRFAHHISELICLYVTYWPELRQQFIDLGTGPLEKIKLLVQLLLFSRFRCLILGQYECNTREWDHSLLFQISPMQYNLRST